MKVLIGQVSTNLSHKHTFTGTKATGSFSGCGNRTAFESASGVFSGGSNMTVPGAAASSGASGHYAISFSMTPSGTISNTGSSEARSNNVSLKIWLRVS